MSLIKKPRNAAAAAASATDKNIWNALSALYVYFIVRCPQMACRFAQKISRHVQKAGHLVHLKGCYGRIASRHVHFGVVLLKINTFCIVIDKRQVVRYILQIVMLNL